MAFVRNLFTFKETQGLYALQELVEGAVQGKYEIAYRLPDDIPLYCWPVTYSHLNKAPEQLLSYFPELEEQGIGVNWAKCAEEYIQLLPEFIATECAKLFDERAEAYYSENLKGASTETWKSDLGNLDWALSPPKRFAEMGEKPPLFGPNTIPDPDTFVFLDYGLPKRFYRNPEQKCVGSHSSNFYAEDGTFCMPNFARLATFDNAEDQIKFGHHFHGENLEKGFSIYTGSPYFCRYRISLNDLYYRKPETDIFSENPKLRAARDAAIAVKNGYGPQNLTEKERIVKFLKENRNNYGSLPDSTITNEIAPVANGQLKNQTNNKT